MQQMQFDMQQKQMNMQLNNQSETMRIQREEMQRASRLQTESTFLDAHKANLNAKTVNNAMDNGFNPYEQQPMNMGGMQQPMGMGGMQQPMMGGMMGGSSSQNSYYTLTLNNVGGAKLPSSIAIYPVDFDLKEKVLAYLDDWNDADKIIVNGTEILKENRSEITYTDTLSIVIAMVNTMINVITTALVAFTAISLVVSTVMIGIITYVSVVERTKEIGVIRSLGGSKKDVGHLFNAETFIIGLVAGVLGIGITYLLSIIANVIIGGITGIYTLVALKPLQAIIMVIISIGLTLISGLIPSKSAANMDPVNALRTE